MSLLVSAVKILREQATTTLVPQLKNCCPRLLNCTRGPFNAVQYVDMYSSKNSTSNCEHIGRQNGVLAVKASRYLATVTSIENPC